VPAALVGQCIHGPLAGDEGGEGHETLHNGREHQQLLLQPFEEAKACFSVGCFEVSGPHTQLAVLKGKCAFGPFLSILVIECKHKCLNVPMVEQSANHK
jgi:hypothetical protein